MATPNGDVVFKAGDQQLVLRFGINALCRLEDRLGLSVMALGDKMREGLDMRTLRSVFACGLSAETTDDEAGEIMDLVGVQQVGQLVGEAFQAAFPSGGADDTGKGPRKAASATGSAG